MPRQDGTGPMGQGQMTGRGLGPCNANAAETDNTPYGRGLGLGRGCGRGRGCSRRGAGLGLGRGAGRGFRGRNE